MKKTIATITFLILAWNVYAQHGSNANKKLADSLYFVHHYKSAAQYYEKALPKDESPQLTMLQIARCLSKINRPKEAVHWFEKARHHNAPLADSDLYLYTNALIAMNKRHDAETLLLEILKDDDDDVFARRTLDDLKNAQKYYKDSLNYRITPLSINTEAAEFAPTYYKDGIVFTSGQRENFFEKKYHWDHSHYLNLYYSPLVNGSFQKPALLHKELNTKFHDGPASFYENGNKLILNRNRRVDNTHQNDHSVWHLGLYDVHKSKDENTWTATPLSFDDTGYSFAHPWISEDGNTMYFVSDKPGGYGGTDIYRVTRSQGVWGKPFNLGPAVNTPGDEMFPFFTHHTLYFSSDGNGGLGGLDIFSCKQTTNGFDQPVNLGYPINTTADDFSLVTTKDQLSGYFSSSRNGNDDLFAFEKLSPRIKLLAYIFDETTRQPLSNAAINILSDTEDIQLTSDENGLIHYELADESAYILVGRKDDKLGMLSGYVSDENDHQHYKHLVPARGDTSRIVCFAQFRNEEGDIKHVQNLTIRDEASGTQLPHPTDGRSLSFMGQKGHTYSITAELADGTAIHERITLSNKHSGVQAWEITVKENLQIELAARIFDEQDNSPLPQAKVKIFSFSDSDLELISDESGIVEFSLPKGTAYMLIATKDELTGMHSGVAEREFDKSKIIHPVGLHSEDKDAIPVMVLVTDKEGELLHPQSVQVTDHNTNESIDATIRDGLVTFLSEVGKEYRVAVKQHNGEGASEVIAVQPGSTGVQKATITLIDQQNSKNQQSAQEILISSQARVFKAVDDSPIPHANVKIISFSDNDRELATDSLGMIRYTLPKETAYVLIADKDGYTGMYSGIMSPETEDSVQLVPAYNDEEKAVPVVVRIAPGAEESMTQLEVTVTENESGKKIPSLNQDGLVSFIGKDGVEYKLEIFSEDNTKMFSRNISAKEKKGDVLTLDIALSDSDSQSSLIVLTKYGDERKYYLAQGDSIYELIEKDGFIFRISNNVEQKVGEGRINGLQTIFPDWLMQLNKKQPNRISINTIYFEFDKASLNDSARLELSKINSIMTQYPALKLVVEAHADDRGNDSYNHNLSKKRAQSVEQFLINNGIKRSRISSSAHGESIPAVRCMTDSCGEETHQKNRRAEFKFHTGVNGSSNTSDSSSRNRSAYDVTLKEVRMKKLDDLHFVINIGAYRHNDSLTFENLSDLGEVKSRRRKGITYYYIGNFETLSEAERVKDEIVKRGVSDAMITSHYQGRMISVHTL